MKSRIPVAAIRDVCTCLKASTEGGFLDEIHSWNGESDSFVWGAESDGLDQLKSWTGRGWTPLHLAAAFGDFHLPWRPTSMENRHRGVIWSEEDILSIREMVTARTERGWTPLHMAAMFREDNFELTWTYLTENMSSGNWTPPRTERGWTPLHLAAAYNKDPSTVERLLTLFGGRKTRDADGWTPLHMAAAFSETPSVVQKLLEAGANPKAKDAEGRIPWDLISDDSPLKGTDVYWWLYEGRFE